MTAVRASRTRCNQIELLVGCRACRLTSQFLAILLPAPHKHNRQTVDHNIQETTNNQTKYSGKQTEGESIRLNESQQRHVIKIVFAKSEE